ncbi:uncharacterized protein Z520_07137 [Fonsecaea multimorphosa CBS 102226]|uniref:MINDY deubiquitinase domain-containing protein n=1 Tax=Fonsecaea multimorphosa CBS 102226 TaxID=1442371 RepID=A0A0D2KK80_9EURO|nr:uncharacterized protein Z520_07137 [Fonsecaea multimorphosa CBS 102226]KIX97023.1 hypothetical protein Z520_07137 [Fonsecaea multimorphosa CBS 102226]OAL22802.1 hypothetical protein AYO22_06710 [Fonsecaea multimorphosa]
MTRKTSLPYPAGPPPQPPLSSYDPESQSNLVPDSADLPPLPSSSQRSPIAAGTSSFQDAQNPWSDLPTKDQSSDRPLPDALRPGQPRPPAGAGAGPGVNPQSHALSNIPQVLRAGRSQEDTPRSSLDSQRSKDFWEDSDGEDGRGKSPKRGQIALSEDDLHADPWVDVEPPEKSAGIKRKPVGWGSSPVQSRPDVPTISTFASNNPFRRPSDYAPGDGRLEISNPDHDTPEFPAKGKELDRGHAIPPTDRFQGLNIENSAISGLPSYNSKNDSQAAVPSGNEHQMAHPPMPQAPPPPPPIEPRSPFSEQPPLMPVSPHHDTIENPWASNVNLAPPTPSPIPFSPSQKQVSNYNDDLLDRGQQSGVVSLKDELETLPNAAQAGTAAYDEPSLLEDDEARPPLPIRPPRRAETEYYDPPEGPPPSKPLRPTIRTTIPSDEDIAKMIEQRNETYQIKHFNWFDHSSRKLRRSSMLTQNKNGPCPLLALVNALILGAKHESQAALDEALRTREQVSLGLIIETLMDELLSRGFDAVGEVMPDVDELNHFLIRLRTGMNANPRFVPPVSPPPNLMDADDSMLNMPQRERAKQKLGTFEATTDMKLYGAFQVPLVHGWLPEPGSEAAKAFARSAQTYEDAQALQFGEEELEYKLMNQGLTATEQNLWEDINAIKNFLKTYPTQLTPYGLEGVQDSIPSGSFAIMFRNDHFSTIYKHPESGQLFTLITDAGYADRDEIIWESLIDISGKHNEFFSGDFMPVSHHNVGDESSTHPAARRTSQLLSVDNVPTATPLSPQEQQEQHDADFAMALQLQEEEEQRQRADRNRRQSSNTGTSGTQQRRSQSGNIPIPLRSTQSPPEVRPPIPPRVSRAPNPGVNRPSDALDEDAPPAYEEAAKGRPYIPPLGSPLHPSAEPSPMNSNTQLTGTVSNISTHSASGVVDTPYHPPGPNAGRRDPRRRMSAYNEMSQYYANSPQRLQPQQGVAGPSGRGGRHGQDRDCIVM